ncbi:hypothetical protein [Vibrio fluminensis]|uniref:hypothetical protein n=1 Tax=Vibrio fluminensis TaxID=2783614 RepID=UPI001886C90A|nr:hypothetical protein [Vibrio fluminensis]
MKRFFPSTIMLTPFLVKPYPHQEEYCSEENEETSETSHSDLANDNSNFDPDSTTG